MTVIDVLVMLRSGREYRLALTPDQIEEVSNHADIGKSRVFIIGKSEKTVSDKVPWNKFFPGVKLYRLKSEVPAKPRTYVRKDKSRVMFASEPAGPIGFLGAVDLHKPLFKTHI